MNDGEKTLPAQRQLGDKDGTEGNTARQQQHSDIKDSSAKQQHQQHTQVNDTKEQLSKEQQRQHCDIEECGSKQQQGQQLST